MVETSDSILEAQLTPLWTGNYPRRYEYKVDLYLTTQPDLGETTVVLYANDERSFVALNVTLDVSLWMIQKIRPVMNLTTIWLI